MTRLYMIRHGQSKDNLEKKHSGWNQVELTEQGLEEARAIGQRLKDHHFDRFYTSDLRRAMQTQEVAFPEVKAKVSWLLREISVGELSGKYVQDCIEEYGELYTVHKENRNYLCFNGENKPLVRARAREFLKLMEKEEGDIAVFSHANYIRCMVEEVLGQEGVDGAFLSNGKLAIIEFSDGEWKVAALNV